MYIAQSTAQAIVDEIGNEIHEHINMMDDSGKIIASTDYARIGSMHEGARRIIEEGLEELYITSQMETQTTRAGINLPLKVNNEIVGVIGITGEQGRVEQFGHIVRHITEIMVEDSLLKDERRFDRRVRYRYLERWVKDNGMAMDLNFIERGKNLGIDIKIKRRVMIFRLNNFLQLSAKIEGQKKMEDIETLIRAEVSQIPAALFLREPTRQICFLPAQSSRQMKAFAGLIAEKVQKAFGEDLLAAVDGHEEGDIFVHDLCEEAGKALEACIWPDRWFRAYRDLDVEIFIHEISDERKIEYLHKMFQDASREELDYYMKLIDTYIDCEGSISAISERLYMHKNTLQYKLRKIEAVTGYDIRKPLGASVLFMAMMFYKELFGGDFLHRV